MSDDKQQPKQSYNKFIRYSSLAFEMIIIIVVAALGGRKLDNYMNNQHPYFTIGFSLLAVFTSLYLLIKNLSNDK